MLGSVREANAIVTVAYRDVLKFTRDPSRLAATLVLPVLLIGLFGEGLQATLGPSLGFNYLTFVFLGVFAQSFFNRRPWGSFRWLRIGRMTLRRSCLSLPSRATHWSSEKSWANR